MNRPRPKTPAPPPPPPPRKGFAAPLVAMAVGLVVFLGVVAFALTRGGEDDDDGATSSARFETAPVQVAGPVLPELVDAGDDAAVGMQAPTLTGVSFDGTPVTIAPDGKAKLVVFLAHWCPHCRREVPVLVDWMAAGGVPAGAEVVAVATATTPARDNYPPSAWLAREGWPTPVLVDSDTYDAGTAYGLSAYPFLVALRSDGTVAARTSGELTPQQLDALVATALLG